MAPSTSNRLTDIAADSGPTRYTASANTDSRFDVTGARPPETVTAEHEAAGILVVAI